VGKGDSIRYHHTRHGGKEGIIIQGEEVFGFVLGEDLKKLPAKEDHFSVIFRPGKALRVEMDKAMGSA